jgi:quercetin dioxygenase-like cupin family protein
MPACGAKETIVNDNTVKEPLLISDAEIFGDIETEAQGLAYGAMVFTVKPGCTTPVHHHASEETWIVQTGDGRAQINGQNIGLIPGARICVPPGVMHSISNTSTADLTVMAFWWRRAGEP